ncbi:Na(+)-translocating NADH-quinone reductase subunit C [Roseimaritima sediminicola]|uniref:Na(+)-translocating NADH-quinone reductase subunit C n=1 Tax=Roseimaritima sediminicola TaxID=2662066 RepID=UPI0012983043|nr:Na(+)-translocating NADH-quinone reductase subunit C [Roseimaritima sediminicola]
MKQRDSLAYTMGVAFALCVVCSLSVSAAYVFLKPRQEENKVLDRQRNIIDAAGLAADELGIPASDLSRDQVDELYRVVEERFVDLRSGTYTTEVGKDYDPREVINNAEPDYIEQMPADIVNPLGSEIRERVVRVYLIKDFKDQNVVRQVVLPVYGKGLWSTLYGYLALKKDIETVQGLTFYEHGETPGLGGEVDNANWKAQWVGRRVFDDEGNPALGVNKGPAPDENPYVVDGLSGATITSNGVTNLLQYWVSDHAYGPYLERLRAELSGGEPVPTTGGGAPPASDAAGENAEGEDATEDPIPVVQRKDPAPAAVSEGEDQ